MNINSNTRVPTEFAAETGFEVKPVFPAPFRAVQESRFERLKNRLVTERLEQSWEWEFGSQVRRAANEAAALAWVTAYPLLVFPVLFEEKAEVARRHAERQEVVRQRSRELLAV
ncbi:MAG TPA: hypothetical protein VN578_20580 [Candidatus Binatia bacterium]|jgi:hypothetical protein|nr:hypothetical protein [Candidatus Binatia bacterium]